MSASDRFDSRKVEVALRLTATVTEKA